MSRVAGLEGDDFFPSPLAKRRPRLPGLARKFQEGAPRYFLDQRELARQAVRRHRGDVLRPRMRVLGGAEHVLRFALAIDFVDFRKLQNRRPPSVFGRERDILSGFQLFHCRFIDAERDWNRPRHSRRKPHLVARANVVRLAHETRQGRERARREHLEIGQVARVERNGREFRAVRRQRSALGDRRFQIDQLAAAMSRDCVVAHAHRRAPLLT